MNVVWAFMGVLAIGLLLAPSAQASENYLPAEPRFVDLRADAVADSLRLEQQNGKWYVIHQVDAGETLYALQRRYGTKVAVINAANPEAAQGLKVGQLLRIPVPAPTKPVSSGKTHTVASGETLFSISKKYGLTLDQLRQWNNLQGSGLSIGQVLAVEAPAATSTGGANTTNDENTDHSNTPTTTQKTNPYVDDEGRTIHAVQPAQTLYAIGRKYGITPAQIKDWNSLTDDALSVGQELVVRQAPTSMPGNLNPEEQSNETVEVAADGKKTESEPTTVIEPERVTEDSTTQQPLAQDNTTVTYTAPGGLQKEKQTGMAQVIEGSGNSIKFMALHPTAPIGTIINVHNDMNNRTVFVRVLGKLPAVQANENVIIKVSQAAYESLGAVNSKFPVTITYMPYKP